MEETQDGETRAERTRETRARNSEEAGSEAKAALSDDDLDPSPTQAAQEEAPTTEAQAADVLNYEFKPVLEVRSRPMSCLTPLALGGVVLLLAAILVPNFIRARARGSLTACKSNLKNIGTALEMYSTDNHGLYPKSMSALTPNYLKTFPECPNAGMTYRAEFGPNAPYNTDRHDDYYYVECHGENHKSVSVTGDFPSYNGIQGLIERRP